MIPAIIKSQKFKSLKTNGFFFFFFGGGALSEYSFDFEAYLFDFLEKTSEIC